MASLCPRRPPTALYDRTDCVLEPWKAWSPREMALPQMGTGDVLLIAAVSSCSA